MPPRHQNVQLNILFRGLFLDSDICFLLQQSKNKEIYFETVCQVDLRVLLLLNLGLPEETQCRD